MTEEDEDKRGELCRRMVAKTVAKYVECSSKRKRTPADWLAELSERIRRGGKHGTE